MPRSDPPNTRSDDSLGSGVESGLVLVCFAGLGLIVDRWLATVPLFTIGFFTLGAIGVFYRLKAGYDEQMDALDAARLVRRAAKDAD